MFEYSGSQRKVIAENFGVKRLVRYKMGLNEAGLQPFNIGIEITAEVTKTAEYLPQIDQDPFEYHRIQSCLRGAQIDFRFQFPEFLVIIKMRGRSGIGLDGNADGVQLGRHFF